MLSRGRLLLAAGLFGLATPGARGGAAAAEQSSVAIIGAGIAGSSAAWFLRDHGLNVTVFEGLRVGGRVHEVKFPQDDPIMLEAGGASIHSLNKYMAQFIDVLGLHRETSSKLGGASAVSSSGVLSWDGQKLAKVNPLEYPLSMLRAHQMVANTTSLWQRIYDLQAQNTSFESPTAMLEALGVAEMARISAGDWFRGRLDEGFIRQFVNGVSKVNYGQGDEINAFADSISLAGAGLVGSLYSVKEGNSKVMEGLLRQSGAALRYARVTSIEPDTNGYRLCTSDSSCQTFESVIIAAPLEHSGIQLGDGLRPTTPPREYKVTVATFVRASGLSRDYFGSAEATDADTVMTTANSSIPFNSIAVHGVSGGQKVYKVFSPSEPPAELLSSFFVNMSNTTRQYVWHAYPVLQPTIPRPPFRLHAAGGGRGGLYYVNAMESPVSCMETEAVGAKNVALLLLRDLAQLRRNGGSGGRSSWQGAQSRSVLI